MYQFRYINTVVFNGVGLFKYALKDLLKAVSEGKLLSD